MVKISGLSYVGKPPAVSNNIANRLGLNNLLAAATPNQTTVASQITNLYSGASPTYATKSYVDQQDATFQPPSYYQSRDALNIPNGAKGTKASSPITGSYYGVASLDAGTKVPLAQMPNMGAGYFKGPFGTTAVATGTTTSTPLKIADWNLGLQSLQFRPWVYLSAFVQGSAGGQPIIEIRIANSVTAPSYAASTLIATGEARAYYNDFQAVVAQPAPDTTGESYPALLPTTYQIWMTAWLYDANGSSVTINTGGIASAAAFLVRGAL